VAEFCRERNIEFSLLHAHGLSSGQGNFEAVARKVRRQLLKNELRGPELLWLGHHLDDSYEWSLLQRYRSSQPKSSLGIPVRNGPIVRPFLCVSKDQLRSLARRESIPFMEDPTNRNIRFERNFLRGELIPLIQRRYPRYLKHYVNHANYLAMVLNLSITNRVQGSQIHVYDNGAIIQGVSFSQFQIQELLQNFSSNKRGELSGQIQRMLKAIDNGKKGPFQFSGGTEIYHTHQLMMIYSRRLKNYDQMIADVLRDLLPHELDQLPLFSWKDLERSWQNLVRSPDAMLNMPGLVLIFQRSSECKTLNASVYDSLFPEVSRVVKERGWCFVSSLKCLDTWKRKRKKLPEKLKLLPLWTLSNLFPFQQ
jgi:tRNA(Ile)-lysidine synthase